MRDLNKATAMVAMARALDQGSVLTARGIATKYGVTIRTAERWLLDMEQIVPVVYEDKRLGHCYREWRLMDA